MLSRFILKRTSLASGGIVISRHVQSKAAAAVQDSSSEQPRQAATAQTKQIRDLLDLPAPQVPDVSAALADAYRRDPSKQTRVVGWVKSFKGQKEVKFLHLVDGSDSTRHLQLVFSSASPKLDDFFKRIHFNAAIEATGVLVKSTHGKQNYELQVGEEFKVINECEPDTYPFPLKGKRSLEEIRTHVHLRSHLSFFAAVLKFRSELTASLHAFFRAQRFVQVHTPVLTSNNCEGGCETFRVETDPVDTKVHHSLLKQQLGDDQQQQTAEGQQHKQQEMFFLKPVFLSASAQLHLETLTTTLARVYTLSPAFRAEKSTARFHLSEFYMLEAELVDMNELSQLLDLVESMVKRVGLQVLRESSRADLDLIQENNKIGTKKSNYTDKLLEILETRKFVRITYKEAVDTLNNVVLRKAKHVKTKRNVAYGEDLNKEQETLLAEHFEHMPVFITHYPKALKPFYMRENAEDTSLVDNFDLIVPKVGEIVGGSLREHRLDLLEAAMKRQGLNMDDYKYYLESKKYGSMKMGGFGLGLERFVQYLANVDVIRDTTAFPRSLFHCKM